MFVFFIGSLNDMFNVSLSPLLPPPFSRPFQMHFYRFLSTDEIYATPIFRGGGGGGLVVPQKIRQHIRLNVCSIPKDPASSFPLELERKQKLGAPSFLRN